MENYRLLKETLHERNYFLYAAPYLNKDLALTVPCDSLIWSLLWYFPGTFLYHMIYLKQLMSSNYTESLKGPSVMFKKKLRSQFKNLPNIHGNYGVVMHEV